MWLFRRIYSCNKIHNSILVTATGGDANTRVVVKYCAPFTKCITRINDEHVDDADNLDIIMSMYILIEYNDSYSGTSGSLWQFQRDESPVIATGNPDDVSTANSSSLNANPVFLNPQRLMVMGYLKT